MLESDILVTTPSIDRQMDIVRTADGSTMGTLSTKYDTFTAAFSGEGTKILTLGDSQKADVVGLDREIGKGRIVLVGLPSAMYAESENGTEQMRALVAYACEYTDYEYTPATLLWTRRGNVVAAHAIEKCYIGGRFINLFDANLTVTDGYTLKAGDSVLLYDVTELDLSMPRLAFAGGTIVTVEETANKTTYRLKSPTGIYTASTLLAPKGLYPQSVTVKKGSGADVSYAHGWNAETGALLVQARGDITSDIIITVAWGEKSVADYEPIFPTYSEFEPVDQDHVTMFADWNSQTYLLNKDTPKSADEFVVVDTSNANHEIKYCDKAREIIYRFDLKEYPHLAAVMYLEQNYLVQVSTDGESWRTIQNFELVNGFRDYGAHKATLVVASDKYAPDADFMYVRLANSDVSQGHGGSISKLIIYYSETGESGDASSEPWETDEPNYLPTDKSAEEWAAYYAEYQSLKILTNAGTETQWRPFIVSSPPDSDAGWRHQSRCIYTDTRRQIVFGFNLSVYPEAAVVMHVEQNYILEVSPNGQDWLIVQDYSAFHDTRASWKEGEAYIAISSELLPKGAQMLYVRLRNTDETQGYGGALVDMTIYHKGSASEPATPPVADEPEQPKGQHVATDVTAEQWATEYADRNSLTVVTNANTESEWRPFAHAMPADSDQGWRNAKCLYTDRKRELVFCFDLNTYRNATVVLHVNQNYIIEVSTNGSNWTEVQNYATYHATRAEYKEGDAYIGVSAEQFAAGATSMYIRIRNTDGTQGYGGALTDFTVYYQ